MTTPLSKRQRRQAVKAMLLDHVINDLSAVEFGDPQDPEEAETYYSLTPAECEAVRCELSDQLYAWAVRITPRQRR